MIFIYALKLTEGKYYVGKSTNPSFRIDNHFNSNGAMWTRKYTPIELIELIPNCDDYDEDKYTLQYMNKYGINNVRGGSFVQMELNNSTMQIITRMNNSTNNKCFVCNKTGHLAKECNMIKYDEKDQYTEWGCDYCNKKFTNKTQCEKHEKQCEGETYDNSDSDSDNDNDDNNNDDNNNVSNGYRCYRCGRSGHYATKCYAVKHIKGYYLK